MPKYIGQEAIHGTADHIRTCVCTQTGQLTWEHINTGVHTLRHHVCTERHAWWHKPVHSKTPGHVCVCRERCMNTWTCTQWDTRTCMCAHRHPSARVCVHWNSSRCVYRHTLRHQDTRVCTDRREHTPRPIRARVSEHRRTKHTGLPTHTPGTAGLSQLWCRHSCVTRGCHWPPAVHAPGAGDAPACHTLGPFGAQTARGVAENYYCSCLAPRVRKQEITIFAAHFEGTRHLCVGVGGFFKQFPWKRKLPISSDHTRQVLCMSPVA